MFVEIANMGELVSATLRQDIARECLHWAVTSGSPDRTPAQVIERAQVYFDWVMKTGGEPVTGGKIDGGPVGPFACLGGSEIGGKAAEALRAEQMRTPKPFPSDEQLQVARAEQMNPYYPKV